MDRVLVFREFCDPDFNLAISLYEPEERGRSEWKVGYQINFNGRLFKGYAMGIDGLDAIVNAISEIRRQCTRLASDDSERDRHLIPYQIPMVDRVFDKYAENLVASARDYYRENKELPPVPAWCQG